MRADEEIITLYYGKDVSEEEAIALRDDLRERYPDCDVEAHNAGRPFIITFFRWNSPSAAVCPAGFFAHYGVKNLLVPKFVSLWYNGLHLLLPKAKLGKGVYRVCSRYV